MHFDRRNFLTTAAAGLGAAWAARRLPAAEARPPGGVGLPAGWRTMRKVDAHNHLFTPLQRPDADWSEAENLLEAADALGIEQLLCSRPVVGGALADISLVREMNDTILAAMRRYPRRIRGYCFVQPGNGRAALDEIERCCDAGMVGVKLYNQFKYDDPQVFPIAERCIERRILLLGHSGFLTDPRVLATQPRISHAGDFGALSRRYPELLLILGHVNGGGDWEWTLRTLRDFPNVHVDTSGSVMEDDTVGDCVRMLGVDRVLFATDATVEGGVGKVLAANLTEAQRAAIFHGNLQRLLDRRRA